MLHLNKIANETFLYTKNDYLLFSRNSPRRRNSDMI